MARTRTSSDVELLVALDRERPPSRSTASSSRASARRSGTAACRPRRRCRRRRALAAQLGVSRGIVVEAYEQLVAEGYLASRPGGATRVARAATAHAGPPRRASRRRPGRVRLPARPPGRLRVPARGLAAQPAARRSREAPSDRLTYLGGHGIPELRIALADVPQPGPRRRPPTRPTSSSAPGFAQGLALAARAMRARGARVGRRRGPVGPRVPRDARRAPAWTSVGVPVDEHGMRVDLLERLDVDGVVVTAAHQYPTGGVLPPERRARARRLGRAAPAR